MVKVACYFFAVCCLIGLGATLFSNHAGLALYNWHITPRPQPYTELYFTKHRQLPASISVGATQKIPFTIHNHEHSTVSYRYKLVAVSDKGTEHQLTIGTVTLAHGRAWAGDPTITMPSLNAHVATIKVILQYDGLSFGSATPSPQRQSIHYWTDIAKKQESVS